MTPFTFLEATVVPIDRANIDTDAILAKQFMKSIARTGFGSNLFDAWRYLDTGQPGMDHTSRPLNPDFALNQPRYAGARILLARENFGCGSSREHAVWALSDHGIRALIAPSFADIFHGNCFKNGLLPIRLPGDVVERLFQHAREAPSPRLAVDLEQQRIDGAPGGPIGFEVDAERKRRLLLGLDDISLTLARQTSIRAYESRRRIEAPWLFPSTDPEDCNDR